MRKLLSLTLVLCFLFSLLPVTVLADTLFIAANPSAEATVTIASAADLLAFAERCRLDSYSMNLRVTLETDLNLTGLDFSGIPIFCGSFDGNGHRISGIALTQPGSVVGFFRYLTESAIVENLRVEGIIAPTGSGCSAGGIAGNNAGLIRNCVFSGNVGGIDCVGGIAGCNSLSGIIENCAVTGDIHGSHFIGGISGNSSGVIRQCRNHAQVNTTIEQNTIELEDISLESLTGAESAATVTDIGGICGSSSGVVRDCENHANVGYRLVGYNIGGIAGSSNGYFLNCVNYGKIEGRKEVGGIAGQLEPAMRMIFEEDTLQTLQSQMDSMTSLTQQTAASAQSGVSAIGEQLAQLDTHFSEMEEALDTLLPQHEDSAPDPDTILAAQNALSSSMSAISGTLSELEASGEDTLGALFRNIHAITQQMQGIGNTLGQAEEALGGSISDVSDQDTPADTTAKVQGCRNEAQISGDRNIGGIVGAITLENDLDPEDDLQIIGGASANFACEFRAVITECENSGSITGNKQNTGGIAGWMSLGLARQCTNTGILKGADYTGGISGLSMGYIRSCIVRCSISGDVCVGGVAGSGVTVTDCCTLVQLQSGSEKIGTILGSMAAEAVLERNYYLPVNGDPGAVDGISYGGVAEPLAAGDFFSLEILPDSFHNLTVTFQFDDGRKEILTIPYASKLAVSQIPSIPEKSGYESTWSGMVKVTDQLFFDVTFSLSHTAHIATLQSSVQRGSLPLLLAQGDFLPSDSVSIVENDGHWQLSLPQGKSSIVLRFLIPAEREPESSALMLQNADGSWHETEFEVDGSYLVFSAPTDTQALRLEKIPVNYLPCLFLIAGAVAVLLLISLFVRKHKKK